MKAFSGSLFSRQGCRVIFFFFNDTATTEIYTLSLHDALPILNQVLAELYAVLIDRAADELLDARSEEHTSELQSPQNLVCRLLLEKKKKLAFMIFRACPGYAFRIATLHRIRHPNRHDHQ